MVTQLRSRTPWRYRCPDGHTSIVHQQNGTIYCQSCSRTYTEKYDAKTERTIHLGGNNA